MNSALSSNLSELVRLLLELNAVQQNSPSFPTTGTHTHTQLCQQTGLSTNTRENIDVCDQGRALCVLTEEAAPPLPSCSITHYENGVGPSSQDKPKRNGTRGGEEGRPTVESLLDELEGSVPTTR